MGDSRAVCAADGVGERDRDLQQLDSGRIQTWAAVAVRVCPSTSSIVMKCTEPVEVSVSSTECSVTMLGWLRAATARASRSNRARRSGSAAIFLGKDLQRDAALELGVLGLPDDTHAALADLLDQAVVE